MTRRLTRFLCVMIFVLSGSALPRPARAQGVTAGLFSLLTTATGAPSYTVTDLGTLGGSYSVPFAINNAGLAVGNSFTANDAAVHAFAIGAGTAKDLGTLGGPSSGANGVNTAGQIAGYSYLADGQTSHAVLWTAGNMRDLGTLGGTDSTASGVDDSGQVVGTADTSGDEAYHAVLWANNNMNDLGVLDPKGGALRNSQAYAINAAGQVVGTADISAGVQHAFVWANNRMQDLGTFNQQLAIDQNSYGSAINAAGQVVGAADTTRVSFGGPEHTHAFLWANGSMTDLGTLGGMDSQAFSINAAGQAVGYSTTRSDQIANSVGVAFVHAVLWSGGVTQDLNQLIPPASGWSLAAAAAINDSGQIVGLGTFNGQERAFLLTPR